MLTPHEFLGLFDCVRESPADDAPRLVLADWLEDNGENERAEFIRVQCRLARLPADHPDRPGLTAREARLLQEHADAWTELAYLKWLEHPAPDCPCEFGHGVCELVIQGIRTRRALDALGERAPERRELETRLETLEREAESLLHVACEAYLPLFEGYEFHRGFLEVATVNELRFGVHPRALVDLAVPRELTIILDESEVEGGDEAAEQLQGILDWLRLETLTISTVSLSPESLEGLTGDERLSDLLALEVLWVRGRTAGTRALTGLARSSKLRSLRSLRLYFDSHEDGIPYSEEALLEFLHSDRFPALEDCFLHDDHWPELSEATRNLYQARFGRPRPDAERV